MDRSEIQQAVQQIAEAERVRFCPDMTAGPEPEPAADDGRMAQFNSGRVIECLFKNQVGDAELYRELFRGKYLYDFAAGIWMVFTGHYWEQDKCHAHMTAMQDVVSIYKVECDRLSWRINVAQARSVPDAEMNRLTAQEKAVRARMPALQAKARIKDVLELTRAGPDGLGTDGEQWDKNLLILSCKNGVLELDSGHFRPGKPDDILQVASNCGFLKS